MNKEYEDWIAAKRLAEVSPDFTERVMREVMPLDSAHLSRWERLQEVRWLRVAVGVAALAVGVARFVYLAVVAHLIEV